MKWYFSRARVLGRQDSCCLLRCGVKTNAAHNRMVAERRKEETRDTRPLGRAGCPRRVRGLRESRACADVQGHAAWVWLPGAQLLCGLPRAADATPQSGGEPGRTWSWDSACGSPRPCPGACGEGALLPGCGGDICTHMSCLVPLGGLYAHRGWALFYNPFAQWGSLL